VHEWAQRSKLSDPIRDGVLPADVQNTHSSELFETYQPPWINSDYRCLWKFGDLEVFIPIKNWEELRNEIHYLPLDFVSEVLNSDLLNGLQTQTHMEESLYNQEHHHHTDDNKSPYFRSLSILDLVFQLYEKLHGALVSLSVLSMPLNTVKWVPAYFDSLGPSEALACIALLATGKHNIEPSIFLDVIGISYGNTLYVREFLLNDPWDSINDTDMHTNICCLTGNVGAPVYRCLYLSVHQKSGSWLTTMTMTVK
jgi:hypothetical protein